MKPQRLAIQGAVLKKHKPESEVILRLCGTANALIAAARTFTGANDREGEASIRRDRVCLWIVVASYLVEAVPILNQRHDGLAWKLSTAGEAAGVTFPQTIPLHKLRALLNKDSDFIKSCKAIRDKFGFHMDADPFIQWVEGRADIEGVGIVSQTGETNEDFIYDAATFSVEDAINNLMINGFGELVAEVMLAFPYLIEAMVPGLAVSKNLKSSTERNEQEDIVLFHEPGAFIVARPSSA